MAFWNRISWRSPRSTQAGPAPRRRRYNVEKLERRQLMAADASPIQLGAVYFEDGTGEDQAGDTIEITFSGGAPGTQLTQLTIDTDKLGDGLTIGDVFFDTAEGGDGAFQSFPFELAQNSGIDSFSTSVVDGGTKLLLNFTGFEAGDRLTFRIDVDEMGFRSANAVAEGNEFEGSKLIGTFAAPHYFGTTGSDIFIDDYNGKLSASGLSLPPDDYVPPGSTPFPVYTAGAMFPLEQVPLPITLSGRVFEDPNQNLQQDPSEPGLAGVTLSLEVWDGTSYLSTGRTAVTDAEGDYAFDGLAPGTYRVLETQPPGYLDVGATAGTVEGVTRGQVSGSNVITEVELLGGEDSIRNDFAEVRPASLGGLVHADLDGDCQLDPGEQTLAGVTVWLLDAQGTRLRSTTTDASGQYLFENLAPGTYGVEEIQPDGYLTHGTLLGTSGGTVAADDRITGITLATGTAATGYDFCEVLPAKLSGFVYLDSNNNGLRDTGETGLAGVTVELLDSNCLPTGRTALTDATGMYMFGNLLPGVYGVQELHPSGYLDGTDTAGTAGGDPENPGDRICFANLSPGQIGTDYNFGELLAASLGGRVFVDLNDDCLYDPGEAVLPGVTVRLFDAAGTLVATTTTNDSGEYQFTQLRPGTYRVEEAQPAGYLEGGAMSGNAGGSAQGTNQIVGVGLVSGQNATEYNFCEVAPASIAGLVYSDLDRDCIHDPEESPLTGVTIELLDSTGAVVASTTTGADGRYLFDNLRPGVYGVRETQPPGYFQGGQVVGNAGGTVLGADTIGQITLAAGAIGLNYDFCEVLPASLSGYVFQDGPTIVFNSGERLPNGAFNLAGLRDGVRDGSDRPLAGVHMVLAGPSGAAILDAEGNPIETYTDANGYYEFTNLFPGTYSVLQDNRTVGELLPGINTAGSKGGTAFNFGSGLPPSQVLAELPAGYDPIANIELAPGDVAVDNNFSEVAVATQPERIPFFVSNDPSALPAQFVPSTPIFSAPAPAAFAPAVRPPDSPLLFGAAGGTGYTWHLSVVNGGQPRAERPGQRLLVQTSRSRLYGPSWTAAQLKSAVWQIDLDGDGRAERVVFGSADAVPLTGDFNGDGRDEVAVFLAGQWYVDLNGDGIWNEDDLWARLGSAGDQPVAGDWDGDGKTDIGIFGAEWPDDPRAVASEPGLPDAQNAYAGDPKNLPPERGRATLGERLLQRTIAAPIRSDVIDHVFQYGQEGDLALVGDWNGDGVSSIGVYRRGRFVLDTNGNGRIDGADRMVHLGATGRPIVGDFDGDGRDEIGLYQDGIWRIDSDHNGRLAANDRVIELGDSASLPVVGDFDGDGADEPGLYRPGLAQ